MRTSVPSTRSNVILIMVVVMVVVVVVVVVVLSGYCRLRERERD